MGESSSFYCELCQILFPSKQQWRSHLLNADHQTRNDLEWGSDTDKQCCLVAYHGNALDNSWVLNHFLYDKTGKREIPVKNFLWWECRPRICILEFCTRSDASAVFQSKRGETKLFRMRWAEDLDDMEWLALFPEKIATKLEKSIIQSSFERPVLQVENVGEEGVEQQQDNPYNYDKKCSSKLEHYQEGSKCPIESLNELAKNLEWLPPTYFVKNIPGGIETCCLVLVNGVEWARGTFSCNDDDAKSKIADKALKLILESDQIGKDNIPILMQQAKLEKEDEDVISGARLNDGNEDDDAVSSRIGSMTISCGSTITTLSESGSIPFKSESKCPIQILKEFTAMKGWPKPKYFPGVTEGNGFICSVVVNSVKFQSDHITGSSMCCSVKEAKKKVAAECMKKLLDSNFPDVSDNNDIKATTESKNHGCKENTTVQIDRKAGPSCNDVPYRNLQKSNSAVSTFQSPAPSQPRFRKGKKYTHHQFECSKCGKKYYTLPPLLKHEFLCSGPLYKCSKCWRHFKKSSWLLKHEVDCHGPHASRKR